MLIDRLEQCGINATDIKKLVAAGFHTVEAARVLDLASHSLARARCFVTWRCACVCGEGGAVNPQCPSL